MSVALVLLGFTSHFSTLNAASFTATLDRDTITLGEQAMLSLTFDGGQPKNMPVPNVPGFFLAAQAPAAGKTSTSIPAR
ncbi:MAG: hypothetical protein WDM80_13075 [Limisphaerales bacterium]